jgi:hypothetical protein
MAAQAPLPVHLNLAAGRAKASDWCPHSSTNDFCFAGASAGIAELLVMYPLDVVKTRAQISAGGMRIFRFFLQQRAGDVFIF